MTETNGLPKQAFRLGQRVQTRGGHSFDVHIIALRGGRVEYSGPHNECQYLAIELTLVPERPPYGPSERLILDRATGRPAAHSNLSVLYRCETDVELAMRRAAEWAEYHAQGDGA